MKIVSVVGARPQFIKAAPVSRVLRERHTEVLVHTGQHYDPLMSDVFFDQLGIPKPDYNLGIGSASHGQQTGEMLVAIEPVLVDERPDRVLVYGDTNSTLAGALAAVKLHVPVAHVEAGLRSFNRRMPEEINRVLTDHVAALLFCPTDTAVRNLAAEGITRGVHNVGDVMYDAVLHNSRVATARSHILDTLGLEPGRYLMATLHRPRNTDDVNNLRAITAAFSELGETVVFPVHPRTRQAIAVAGVKFGDNVRVIEPVGYLDSLALLSGARQLLTDSGGMQKEAYFLGVPCVTLREETEWVETLAGGWNVLAGADQAKIVAAVGRPTPDGQRDAYFGDGQASVKIVDVLSQEGQGDPSHG